MPLPKLSRSTEYATKAVELGLRTVGQAPEIRRARRLAAQAPPPAPGARRVLFLTPRDWAAHVQYEAVIGQALRLRGADVRFATCGGGLEICDRANTYEAPPMPCTTCDRYVRTAIDAHGFPILPLQERWAGDDDPGSWPELDVLSGAELLAVEHHGLPLGRLVDIPVKWFLCAADVEDDPLWRRTQRRFLRSARRITAGLESILDEVQPDVVVLLNGLFLFESIAWALCRARGIDVVTYERAFRKETLVFSRDVPAGFYDLSAAWRPDGPALTEAQDAELEDYLARRRSGLAEDQFWTPTEPSEVAGGTSGRLAVLFTNLTWDTAVIGRDCAFPDIQSWLDAVIHAFEARPEHRLVIRVHPSEVHLPGKVTRDSLAAHLAARHPDLPPNVTILQPDDPTSSYPLMQAADVGLVYTSTTGLELALSGVPTIVAGETHYRGKGFTVDVSSPEEFEDALDAILADPTVEAPDVSLARRYAHFFFFTAPIAAAGVTEPLPGLARLTIEDLHELAPGGHEGLDRICDGILDGKPFV